MAWRNYWTTSARWQAISGVDPGYDEARTGSMRRLRIDGRVRLSSAIQSDKILEESSVQPENCSYSSTAVLEGHYSGRL